MPFSGNRWDDSKLVPYRAALAAARARHQLQPGAARPHDTATLWRAAGARGSVGFISSMTQHFCSSCNRLRLTADGNLKVRVERHCASWRASRPGRGLSRADTVSAERDQCGPRVQHLFRH